MAFQTLLQEIEPRRRFAIDGLGALLSTFLLGGVLARHQSTFGMPAGTLYVLATPAACLCIYASMRLRAASLPRFAGGPGCEASQPDFFVFSDPLELPHDLAG